MSALAAASGLARNTAYNIIGQALPALLALVTMPVVIRELGADRFAILSIAWVILGNAILFDIGMGKAATKFASEALARGERDRVPRIIGSTLWAQFALGVAACAFFSLTAAWLTTRVLHIPEALQDETRRTLLLLGAVMPVVLATTSYRGLLEAAHRFDIVNAFKIVFSAITFLAPLLGVLLGWDLAGIMAFLAASRFVQLIAMHLACAQIFTGLTLIPAFDISELRRMLGFGGWIAFSNALAPIQNHLERMVLAALLPIAALTFYAVPFEVMTSFCLISSSLASPLFPLASLLEAGRRDELIRVYRQAAKALLIIMGLVLFPVVSLADVLLGLWVGPDIAVAAAPVARLLSIGVMAASCNMIAVSVFWGSGRPDVVVKQQLLRLPIMGAVSWLLISHFGLPGAAMSWAFGQTVTTTMYYWSFQRILGWRSADLVSKQMMFSLVFPIAVYTAILALESLGVASGALSRLILTGLGMLLHLGLNWSYALSEDERHWIAARTGGLVTKMVPSLPGGWG